MDAILYIITANTRLTIRYHLAGDWATAYWRSVSNRHQRLCEGLFLLKKCIKVSKEFTFRFSDDTYKQYTQNFEPRDNHEGSLPGCFIVVHHDPSITSGYELYVPQIGKASGLSGHLTNELPTVTLRLGRLLLSTAVLSTWSSNES